MKSVESSECYQGRVETKIRAQQGRALPRPPQEGGNYVNTQINELGDRFTNTVLEAERRSEIMPVEASDILDVRPVHFDRIRRQIEDQSARIGV